MNIPTDIFVLYMYGLRQHTIILDSIYLKLYCVKSSEW